MKVKITTVYENVDQPWLDWYLESLSRNDDLSIGFRAEQLKESRVAIFRSKDPTSDVVATTKYEILD